MPKPEETKTAVEEPKYQTAKKIEFPKEARAPRIGTVEGKPTDPLENFRQVTCEKGHIDWNPKKIIYSIDHRSYILYCNSCEEHFTIPAGGVSPISLPAGVVPA